MIMDKIFGLERIEFEKLDQLKVEEVMLSDIPRLKTTDPVLKGVHAVTNNGFVCVENEEQVFEGIFTRRVVLKRLNEVIHSAKNELQPSLFFAFISYYLYNDYIK